MTLDVVAPAVEAHVVAGESLDRAKTKSRASRDVIRRVVGWFADRCTGILAALELATATLFPSFAIFGGHEAVPSAGFWRRRGSALIELRRALVMADRLRQLMPEVYPPTMVGGALAVLLLMASSSPC